MAKIFLRLNDKFALGAGAAQWILYRSRYAYPSPRTVPLQTWDWLPIATATRKALLVRSMREKGCRPWREAQVALDALPPTFAAWKAAYGASQPFLEAL